MESSGRAWTGKKSTRDEDGKQVEEAERHIFVGAPVGYCDGNDEKCSFEEDRLGTTAKEEGKHRDARRFSHILVTQSLLSARDIRSDSRKTVEFGRKIVPRHNRTILDSP